MAWKSEQIYMHGLNVDVHHTCRLSGIDEEQQIVLTGDATDLGHGLDDPGDVARVDGSDQSRGGCDRLADGVGIEAAVTCDRYAG